MQSRVLSIGVSAVKMMKLRDDSLSIEQINLQSFLPWGSAGRFNRYRRESNLGCRA